MHKHSKTMIYIVILFSSSTIVFFPACYTISDSVTKRRRKEGKAIKPANIHKDEQLAHIK